MSLTCRKKSNVFPDTSSYLTVDLVLNDSWNSVCNLCHPPVYSYVMRLTWSIIRVDIDYIFQDTLSRKIKKIEVNNKQKQELIQELLKC